MPANKNALFRYAIIDSCLQRRRSWTFDELQQAVLDAYRERYGPEASVSTRTLRADIANMKPGGTTGYEAPIAFTPERGYRYTVPGYAILQSPISLSDLPILRQVLANLRQLLGLGLTDELEELVQRLEYRLSQAYSAPTPAIIQFEAAPTYVGLPWLAPLYQAIRQGQAVALTYQPFHADAPLIKLVHPHLLKEYNHRWFLLGVEDGQTRVSTFALDRIQALDLREGMRYCPIGIDPETYFQHIIGAAVPEEAAVETIRLRFSASRAPYVRTKPLHPQQQIVADGSDGMDVVLHLIPTQELLTLLLGYGADLKVVAPLSLQEKMRQVLRQSLAAYEE
jgi:predicted DNA-binding transcriptional regulator YafY